MANKTYKVEFGDYQMELVHCEVFYRKWNSDRGCYELVKARSVNNTFGSHELVKEAKQHADLKLEILKTTCIKLQIAIGP